MRFMMLNGAHSGATVRTIRRFVIDGVVGGGRQ